MNNVDGFEVARMARLLEVSRSGYHDWAKRQATGPSLAIAPTFGTDSWPYAMHTTPIDNRIVRMKLIGGKLETDSEQILLKGILRNKFHNGGRLRFAPDGKLYASTGDAQNGDNAQNTNGLNGEVLRLNPDGMPPGDTTRSVATL